MVSDASVQAVHENSIHCYSLHLPYRYYMLCLGICRIFFQIKQVVPCPRKWKAYAERMSPNKKLLLNSDEYERYALKPKVECDAETAATAAAPTLDVIRED